MKPCMRMFRVPDPQNTNTGFCQKKQRIFFPLGIGGVSKYFSVNFSDFTKCVSVCPEMRCLDVSLAHPDEILKFGSKSMPKTNKLQTWTCGCLYSGCLADCLNLNSVFAVLLIVGGLLAWSLWYVVPCVTGTMETLYWSREVAEATRLDF